MNKKEQLVNSMSQILQELDADLKNIYEAAKDLDEFMTKGLVLGDASTEKLNKLRAAYTKIYDDYLVNKY